jgi:phage internal scaffolding protein
MKNNYYKDSEEKKKRAKAGRRPTVDCSKDAKGNDLPSRTKQEFKDECDINNIVKRYKKTGVITHYKNTNGVYGDFSNPVDYQTALNSIMEANDMFMELNAELRKKFDNDPKKLIEFINDEKNRDEAIKLGIIEKPPVSEGNQGELPASEATPSPEATQENNNA